MRWYWWLAAFIAGFVIYVSVFVGSNFFHTVPAALVGELFSGTLLVGLFIALPMWVCFVIGRFLRRRWDQKQR